MIKDVAMKEEKNSNVKVELPERLKVFT